MSLGIDLGNDYMVVTAVRQGVDVLQNDVGKRKTRMCVTYNADNREIGDDSFSQYLSKFNTSAMYFKRLLGKQYGIDDADIEKEKKFLPNKFTAPSPDGTPSTVKYVIPRVGELPPEQALCTMLLKAKQIWEINAENQPVNECVITVPTDWNNAQRLAMMHAADMAGLKVLELANETTCLLYQYGLQRDIQDTRIVMFYDIGATSTSCTLARISKEHGEVLAYESDSHLGGRDFIECIVDEVVKYCKEKKNIVVEPNSKAWLKIRRACEKTFHTLSANHQASCSVENVLDGVDISVPYTRESFYDVLRPRFEAGILAPIRKIIEQFPELMGADGKLQVSAFEIIGGVTRVPLVQQLLVDNFGVTLSKTLDADEAIARGAALRCAALSTTKRINRKFSVTDKKVHVELSLNKAPATAKEGDALEKYVIAEEDVILTKQFSAAYPVTYPQPRLLSLKFQKVQLPVIIGVRVNSSPHDNVRSLILPQSKVDGRFLSETAQGNEPTDIKVSLSLNSSGYLNVYHVETVPPKVDTPTPAPTQLPTMTDSPAPTPTEAPATPASTEMGDGEKAEKSAEPTMTDAPATDAPAADAEAPKADEHKEEHLAVGEHEQLPPLVPPHSPTPHAEPAPETPVPTPVITPSKPVPLVNVNHTIGALSNADLAAARESEAKLQARDAETARRQEAYNNLESYLFTTRSRLNDSQDLPQFMTPEQVSTAAAQVKKLLDWLDDEGYDADTALLESKLADAKKHTDEANMRLHNWKNLQSSHFAFKATLEVAIAHKWIHVEKFAKWVPELQTLEENARKILETGDKLSNTLAVTSPQLDQKNTALRHMINVMDKYDPEKERQEEERRKQEEAFRQARAAEEEQRKAAMAAQQAQQAAMMAAQQQAAAAQAQAQAQAAAAQAEAEAQSSAAAPQDATVNQEAPQAQEETKMEDQKTEEDAAPSCDAAAAAAAAEVAPAAEEAKQEDTSMGDAVKDDVALETEAKADVEEVAPAAPAAVEAEAEVAPVATEAEAPAPTMVDEEPTPQ